MVNSDFLWKNPLACLSVGESPNVRCDI